MIIGIASDHRGYIKKTSIIKYLTKRGHQIIDCGTDSKLSVDYPTFAFKIGELINTKEIEMGILLCGTGIGMSIACNKVKNIRCAKVDNVKESKLAKLHNNANVISLSSYVPVYKTKDILDIFLKTSFSNEEKHIKRNEMIDKYDN